MHGGKNDSEVASSELSSSPTRSPRRPVYYVQSPSRDSHDDFEKATTTNSLHSCSPAGSPPRSNSSQSVGRHSRESSSTRFSSGSAVASGKDEAAGGGGGGRGRGRKHKAWARECAVIEEEGLLEDDGGEKGIPRRYCYVLFFVLAFAALFSVFSLFLWGASRSQKPQITMKSIRFEDFNIQAGTDASGVPTDMASMNATVTLTFRNTATFFGLHVSSTPVDLIYTQLTMASGNIKSFYQSRKSQRTLAVAVLGNRIPMYGGSSSFSGTSGGGGGKPPVPLRLSFTVRSRAYVLGELVKPKFYITVDCAVAMNQNKLGAPVSLKNSCHYN